MKQINYIVINQGTTNHGDVTEQMNAALTTANENFTTLDTSVTSCTASVTALSGKVTAVEKRVTTLEAANVDATQSNSGKMTAAHVKALNAATDKSVKNATAIETLKSTVENKVDKDGAKQLSDENFSKAEKEKLAGIAAGATSFSGSYADLTNKPSIPSKTSDITNDSGFLTTHQDISGKVDKEDGKSLMTDAEREKLSNVEGRVTIAEMVSGVTIAEGSTAEDGTLVYDSAVNKLLWKVMYPENPTPTYFATADLEPLAGTLPKQGVVYLCGTDTYLGVDGKLILQRNNFDVDLADAIEDADEIILKKGNKEMRLTASALQLYANHGLTVKIDEV